HSPAVLTTVRREHIHLLGSDHNFEQLPEDVGTYGAESSQVLAEVFGTHPRPPTIETVDELRKYLSMTEQGKHGSDDAKALRKRLEAALGSTDPDLQRADLRARQIAVLGRK
ncbi:MAG TPA: hypothetical protein PKE16_19160, partial [Hyphomicrobium sp.]|nr:hypothetical protein [Hyphomicrobium sp.]